MGIITTSAHYPTIITTTATGEWNDEVWIIPNAVSADDDSYAGVSAATFDANLGSYLLKLGGFKFEVPTGATVNGIIFQIEKYGTASDAEDGTVQLTKNFTAGVGNDLRIVAGLWPTTLTATTYGGTSNLWGTTWSPSEVNNDNFGLLFSVSSVGTNTDAFVDYIRTTVTYTISDIYVPRHGFIHHNNPAIA